MPRRTATRLRLSTKATDYAEHGVQAQQRREPEEHAERIRRRGPSRRVVRVQQLLEPASEPGGKHRIRSGRSRRAAVRRTPSRTRTTSGSRVSSPMRVSGSPRASRPTPRAVRRPWPEPRTTARSRRRPSSAADERVHAPGRRTRPRAPASIGDGGGVDACARSRRPPPSGGRRRPARRSGPCRLAPPSCGPSSAPRRARGVGPAISRARSWRWRRSSGRRRDPGGRARSQLEARRRGAKRAAHVEVIARPAAAARQELPRPHESGHGDIHDKRPGGRRDVAARER